MQTLWMFRHSQSKRNLDQLNIVGGRSNETPLTPLGESESRQLGGWIAEKGLKPDVIYSSPAVRTVETARIALTAAGITRPVIIDDRLQELSQGSAEGRLRHEVYTQDVLDKISLELMDFRLDGGESMNDVGNRGVDWWQEVRQAREAKVVFAFTHGYTIRCFVGGLLDWSHSDIRMNDVVNAAATCLVFADDGELQNVQFNINTQAPELINQGLNGLQG